MNVSAHLERKNEKTGKREAEEERKHLREVAYWPSAVVQREVEQKNGLFYGSAKGMVCMREVQKIYWDTLEGQQSF